MNEEIRPALTAEEWAEAFAWHYGIKDYLVRPAEGVGFGNNSPADLARVAALALQHAGPDGGPMFTWEDVDALRQVIAEAECNGNRECPGISQAESIVDCIAALLPPRGP